MIAFCRDLVFAMVVCRRQVSGFAHPSVCVCVCDGATESLRADHSLSRLHAAGPQLVRAGRSRDARSTPVARLVTFVGLLLAAR